MIERSNGSDLAALPTFERAQLRERACPNCSASGALESFYQVSGVPRHSCLMMRSRAQALGYARGDLHLAFCRSCGFVTNTAFDVTHNEYSTRYEETQGFSPTFNAFASRIAADLIERNRLHGRTLLEIGCGKGEFLIEACRIGGCRGIGFDPSYRRDRHHEEHPGITFHQRLYDESCAGIRADCYICRHTLEHIGPTLRFMRMLRESIGDREDAVLFFELPDITRQLQEGAFWDMFYEHCSYFSPGSLVRLFRQVGLATIGLERTYRDQYLLITAAPMRDGSERRRHPLEDDFNVIREGIANFERVAGGAISRWSRFIRDRAAAGKRIVLWGSGSKSVGFLTTLGIGDEIEYVVDINPHKSGLFQPGLPQMMVGPDHLKEYQPDTVIVMNPIYLKEIGEALGGMAIECEMIAL